MINLLLPFQGSQVSHHIPYFVLESYDLAVLVLYCIEKSRDYTQAVVHPVVYVGGDMREGGSAAQTGIFIVVVMVIIMAVIVVVVVIMVSSHLHGLQGVGVDLLVELQPFGFVVAVHQMLVVFALHQLLLKLILLKLHF